MIISIKTIAKVLSSSPVGRKMFKSGIRIILNLLESQRLIDWRKLDEVSLDWDKGTLNLGDGMVDQIVGRAVSEYVVDRKKYRYDKVVSEEIAAKVRGGINKNIRR